MKRTVISVILLVVVIACFICSFLIKETKEYTSDLFYMDTYINIRFYTSDSKKATVALEETEQIYSDYHKLSDRYNAYDNITNLYTILHNKSNDEYLEIDSRLYDMISYGLEWKEKSNGKFDVSIGNVIDIWKNYRDIGVGIPNDDELKIAKLNTISNIELKDNNLILNNHPNIDLGAIAKGTATEEVGKYLESIGINKYIINAGGSVKVGKHYNNSKYSIGIENPDSNGTDIYKVVYGNNISVVTSGGYLRFYEYNGKKYHHIIDPDTLMPPTYSKSVTVVCNDSKLGDVLSTILYLLPIDEAKAYLKNFDNVEAIWYTNDNKIITTEGFYKYESK